MSQWRVYQLQEIANITMGQSPKGEYTNEIGKGLPLLNGPTEFQTRYPVPLKVSLHKKDSYIQSVKEINDDELLDRLIEQNYFIANTATRKYRVLRYGFYASFIGYIILFLAAIFWLSI